MARVSVVIVNYNCSAETIMAVASVKKFLSQHDEIVVVDNGSTPAQVDILKKHCEASVIIQSDKNLGFGRGCNLGVEKCGGAYILFLNPDCVVHTLSIEGWIKKLVTEKIAILAPRIVYPDGTAQANGGGKTQPLTYFLQLIRAGALFRFIQKSPLNFLTLPIKLLKTATTQRYIQSLNASQNEQEFDWLSGATLFLLKDPFIEVGGFDQNIFLYNEDEDLCVRMSKFGRMVRDNRAVVEHSQGITQKNSSSRLGLGARSRFLSNLYILNKRGYLGGAIALRLTYLFWFLSSALLMALVLNLSAASDRLKLIRDLLTNRNTQALP